jgi:hypothetical protein
MFKRHFTFQELKKITSFARKTFTEVISPHTVITKFQYLTFTSIFDARSAMTWTPLLLPIVLGTNSATELDPIPLR